MSITGGADRVALAKGWRTMYCSRCGTKLDDQAIVCSRCATPTNRAAGSGGFAAPSAEHLYGHAMASDLYVSPKSRLVMLLLCTLVGVPGVHRFYAGRIITGIIWLFTLSLFGIGWLYDMILIICGAFRDGEGRRIVRWE